MRSLAPCSCQSRKRPISKAYCCRSEVISRRCSIAHAEVGSRSVVGRSVGYRTLSYSPASPKHGRRETRGKRFVQAPPQQTLDCCVSRGSAIALARLRSWLRSSRPCGRGFRRNGKRRTVRVAALRTQSRLRIICCRSATLFSREPNVFWSHRRGTRPPLPSCRSRRRRSACWFS